MSLWPDTSQLGRRGSGAEQLAFYSRTLRGEGVAEIDLAHLDRLLEALGAAESLVWAWRTFRPRMVASSSFQTQSLPLLHLISEHVPELPVLFLDTGFHFQETLAYRDHLTERLGLELRVIGSGPGHKGTLESADELYRTDPDLCCYARKVEPLERTLAEVRAWTVGIRRDQTAQRGDTPIISRRSDGLFKICPLAAWTADEVRAYISRYDLPEHPLEKLGYRSVGCVPCTRPVRIGEEDRAGRWSGSAKTECGLHLPLEGRPRGRR